MESLFLFLFYFSWFVYRFYCAFLGSSVIVEIDFFCTKHIYRMGTVIVMFGRFHSLRQ
jgi:hypothetical protein